MRLKLNELLDFGQAGDGSLLTAEHRCIINGKPLQGALKGVISTDPSVAAATSQSGREALRAARSAARTAFLFTAGSTGPELGPLAPGTVLDTRRFSGSRRSQVELPITEDAMQMEVPRKPSLARIFNLKARTSWTLQVVQALSADPWNVAGWRVRHNYDLDRGMKFGIQHKSPMILDTNLFTLAELGCYSGERGKDKSARELLMANTMAKLTGDFGKEWWEHPTFIFGEFLGRIHVTLTDLTSGEIRWDAIYDCQDSPFLFRDDKPIGGQRPYFQPDWCPAASGPMAHRFRLTVKNLDELPHPGLEDIGEILFTQFGPIQLAHTYAFENDAPPDPENQPSIPGAGLAKMF